MAYNGFDPLWRGPDNPNRKAMTTQEIVVIPDSKTRLYRVAESVSRNGITVPAGFEYDGASIPRFAWSIIGSPFAPEFMTAALFHDWLYHTHQLSREEADSVLYKLLRENGVGAVKASTIHRAVRMFGGAYWPNDGEDDKRIKELTGV